jgi:hypothetical protein
MTIKAMIGFAKNICGVGNGIPKLYRIFILWFDISGISIHSNNYERNESFYRGVKHHACKRITEIE